MSGLNFNTLQGTSGVVRVAQPNVIYAPGHAIQVKWNLSNLNVVDTTFVHVKDKVV